METIEYNYDHSILPWQNLEKIFGSIFHRDTPEDERPSYDEYVQKFNIEFLPPNQILPYRETDTRNLINLRNSFIPADKQTKSLIDESYYKLLITGRPSMGTYGIITVNIKSNITNFKMMEGYIETDFYNGRFYQRTWHSRYFLERYSGTTFEKSYDIIDDERQYKAKLYLNPKLIVRAPTLTSEEIINLVKENKKYSLANAIDFEPIMDELYSMLNGWFAFPNGVMEKIFSKENLIENLKSNTNAWERSSLFIDDQQRKMFSFVNIKDDNNEINPSSLFLPLTVNFYGFFNTRINFPRNIENINHFRQRNFDAVSDDSYTMDDLKRSHQEMFAKDLFIPYILNWSTPSLYINFVLEVKK